MKNNKFFEVHCNINHNSEDLLKLNFPMSLHWEFQQAVLRIDAKKLEKLTEIFAEFEVLSETKRQTFQALVDQKGDEIKSFDQLIEILKSVRLCTAFCGH